MTKSEQKEIKFNFKKISKNNIFFQNDLTVKDIESSFIAFINNNKKIQKKYNAKIKQGQLLYVIGTNNKDKEYHTIEIPKKNGGFRKLDIPSKKLRFIQRLFLDILFDSYRPYKTAKGFTKGESIITNAKIHKGQKFILNIDLEDFFPSIHWGRICGLFMSYPFNFSKSVSQFLANLFIYNDSLPQGAPTSPYLSNMICRKLDSRLFNISLKESIKYTRYADDITFSSYKNRFDNDFESLITRIIEEEGFKINSSKTRLQPYYRRQSVTGLIVNSKVNVKRDYIRNIRAILHNVEKSSWKDQASRTIIPSLADEIDIYKSKKISLKLYLSIRQEQKKKFYLIDPRALYSPISKKLVQYLDNRENQKYLFRYHSVLHDFENGTEKLIHRKNKKASNKQIIKFKKMVQGRIEFVGMVRGKDDKIYNKLKEKFSYLSLFEDEADKISKEEYKKLKNIYIEDPNLRVKYRDNLKYLLDNGKIEKIKKLIVEFDYNEYINNRDKYSKEISFFIAKNPVLTGCFFSKFQDDDSFGGLTHSTHALEKSYRDIYLNCEKIIKIYSNLLILPRVLENKLNYQMKKFSKEIKKNEEFHPNEKQFKDNLIIPFRKLTRFEDSSDAFNLIDELEKYKKELNNTFPKISIIIPATTPKFYTLTNTVFEGLKIILESMVSNTLGKKVTVNITLNKHSEFLKKVIVEIYDDIGSINKAQDLTQTFSVKLKRTAKILRGFCEWYLHAKFADQCYYCVDVFRNMADKKHTGDNFIKHELIFYY